jgi:hypothetical protein
MRKYFVLSEKIKMMKNIHFNIFDYWTCDTDWYFSFLGVLALNIVYTEEAGYDASTFSTDDAILKILYLAIWNAGKKWTMPIMN